MRDNWILALAIAVTITVGCGKEETPPTPAAPAVAKPAPKAGLEHAMDKAHEGMAEKTHEAMKTAHEGFKTAHEDAKATMATGQAVYEKTCIACHKTGGSGAPKLGDKESWGALLGEGVDHLVQHAISGEGAMPPKGGNPDLSEEEIRAAVIYMLDQSR